MESFSLLPDLLPDLLPELGFCIYVPVYSPKDCHDLLSGKL
jgi:hypothetical protein